jgi:predicted RNA binding protein YcfA (HicA-like mRNA interferase family)
VGRLAGLSASDIIGKLRRAGFELERQGRGSHELWWNPQTLRRTVVPRRRGDIDERTTLSIINQAGLTVDEFLEL